VDEVWTLAAAIFFTFVGIDEGDEISGAAADVAFNAEDDTITGTMRYHLGDDLPFVWRREIRVVGHAFFFLTPVDGRFIAFFVSPTNDIKACIEPLEEA
jgi:hypothetical protein